MAKYKISYSGFAYVEADNKEEALEMFDDDLDFFREQRIDSITDSDGYTEEV